MTPTALKVAASTDCVLAALLRLQVSISVNSRNGLKYGQRAGEIDNISIQRKREREIDFLDDSETDLHLAQGPGRGHQGWGQDNRRQQEPSSSAEGYTGLIPQFSVSLLTLTMESTAVIFEAERGGGGGESSITPMTR